MMLMVKIVYAFFVGLLLTAFVGVGIFTFYKQPTPPDSRAMFEQLGKLDPDSEEFKKIEVEHRAKQEQFELELSEYYKVASIIALIAAVVFVVVGLAAANKLHVLSDGLLLGGIFTLIYSISSGFLHRESTHHFVIISVSLAVALGLGYVKFIMPTAKPAAKKAKRR